MSKEDVIVVSGVVVELLPNVTFKIKLENGITILATLAGRVRHQNIKIVLGDSVRVELSPYDLKKGRIIWRENV